MKRFLRLICLLLVFATLAAVPSYAQEVTPRGSDELSSYRAYCTKTSANTVVVSFVVVGTTALDEIGANTIKLQFTYDGSTWVTVKTFKKAVYPTMVDYNTGMHGAELSATVPSGLQYRAYVEFYGEKDGNFTERSYYTSVIS